MAKHKSATYNRILIAARSEFMEKGFRRASVRTIANEAGLTAAGIYRHFTNKEAIFSALVDPLIDTITRRYEQHKAHDYALLDQNQLDALWNDTTEFSLILDLIYQNFPACKLLLCRSEGTKYRHFLDTFVSWEEQETLLFLDAARQQGIPVKTVRTKELHLLFSAYVTALFEVVVHDFSKEEAKHYFETLQAFFVPGWRTVLGL